MSNALQRIEIYFQDHGIFCYMKITNNLDLITKLLKNLSLSEKETNELYIFISQNADQFFEISERMVTEVKNIKDRHPNNWKEMRKRLMDLNPNSFRRIVGTLLEVNGRGYWETSDENIEQLKELYQEVEDKIEGVKE